jgi:rare lipoprotein A
LEYVATHTHTPIQREEGLATWYTAPYKGRKSANGQVFDDNAMTAAHRTLPMGSLVEVTNLRTGQSAVMRITDRGPFVEGRMLDLTQLVRKYSDANVIEFPGENSYWVRIRPGGDDRKMAEYIAQHLQPKEGEAYLTRLD